MSVLIRGMEMPKNVSLWLVIRPDGTTYKIKNGANYGEPQTGKAVQIPEGHGRLIDADVVIQTLKRSIDLPYNKRVTVSWSDAFDSFVDRLEEQDVIIEAEGGGED